MSVGCHVMHHEDLLHSELRWGVFPEAADSAGAVSERYLQTVHQCGPAVLKTMNSL